jgi:hypothetical protein
LQQGRLAHERADLAQEKEQLQRQTATHLYRALLGRAEAVRTARKPGFRKEVWNYLHEAARLDVPVNHAQDIAAQVVACLADPIGLEAIKDFKSEMSTTPETSRHLETFGGTIPERTQQIAYSRDGDLAAIAEQVNGDSGDQASIAVTVKRANDEVVARSDSEIRPHIYDLEFATDGTRLAAACEQGLVVWDVPDLRQIFVSREDATLAVAFAPHGRRLATVNNNGTVQVRDLDSGRVIASFHGLLEIRNIAFSSDGQHLIGASTNNRALIAWPIRDTPEHRVLLAHQKGVPDVAFSPDGRFLVSVAQDGMTKVWNGRTGAPEAEWAMPHCDLQSVTFHPDGQLLATADWQGRIHIRSFPSGEMIRVLTMPHGKENWALGFCSMGRWSIPGGRSSR